MNKLIIFLFFFSISSFARELIIGIDGGYPPLSQIDSKGNLSGFDVDIANAICEELKIQCKIKQIDWENLIPALQHEKIDLIVASMNITEEREKIISFSIPYYHNPGIFVRKKNTDIEINKEKLKNKTIGVLSASVFDNYISKNFSDVSKINRYLNQDDANLDAQKGVIDVLFGDKIALEYAFLNNKNREYFEKFAEINDPKIIGKGIGIALRKKDKLLLEQINNAIINIRKNGKYMKINNKYFDYDIYGE